MKKGWLYISLFLLSSLWLNASVLFAAELMAKPPSQTPPTFIITVLGLSGAAKANVENRLKLLTADWPKRETSAAIRLFLQDGTTAAKEALAPFGYFSPVVYLHTYLLPSKDRALRCVVTPSKRVTIRSISVSIVGAGSHTVALQNFEQRFPIHAGMGLDTTAYLKAKQVGLDTAEAEGYLAAHYTTARIRIDRRTLSASITLILDTGALYYFGDVTFSPSPLSDSFLKRYVPFKTGERFSSVKLGKLQDDLSGSQYFQQVNINANREHARAYHVPIKVHLVPRKRQLYSAGLGYGTDTGPRASFGWNFRWVNPEGHTISALVSLSPVEDTLLARYVIPGEHPAQDQIAITTGLQRIDVDTGKSLKAQIGIGSIVTSGDWQRTIGLNFQTENYEMQSQEAHYATYLLPYIQWHVIKGNRPLFPSAGYSLTFLTQAASASVLSKTTFVQSEINFKYIHEWTGLRAIMRTDLGYTISRGPTDLPYSLLFRAGGAQSVRGFGYEGLGPGRYLLVGSAELQPHIVGDLYGAVFYDAGNAFNDFPMHAARGAGMGLVYRSPMGPIELTYARALSVTGHPGRIQLFFGTDL